MVDTGKILHVIGILPELPRYRLPGRFSVRPALRTQGEKGNAALPRKMLYENAQYFTKATSHRYVDTLGKTLRSAFHL